MWAVRDGTNADVSVPPTGWTDHLMLRIASSEVESMLDKDFSAHFPSRGIDTDLGRADSEA